MKNHFQKGLILFFIFFLALFLISCGEKEKTDEDLILELVENMSRLAEKKDISNLMMNFVEDYSDFEGQGKSETEDMLRQYFKQYRGIVIHVLSTRIDEIKFPEASIQTEVALSSGAAKVFRKLVRLSTDNYRLKIKLTKIGGQWQIQYAEWKYVTLNELFPQSLSILKKIFPNI